jgi:hypothetical protein
MHALVAKEQQQQQQQQENSSSSSCQDFQQLYCAAQNWQEIKGSQYEAAVSGATYHAISLCRLLPLLK